MLFSHTPNHKLTKENEKKIQNRIDRAKITLMSKKGTTFFSALLANLKLIVDRSRPTAAVDGVSLWINPDMVSELTEHELVGVLLHEVMHVAAEHTDATIYGNDSGLDQYILGLAMDHWINLTITSQGYKLPDFVIKDSKYKDWATMKIYYDLMKNPPPKPPEWQPDVVFGSDKDKSVAEHQETVQSNIMKAAMQAQMADDAGSIPGNIKIMIEDLVSPQLPWNIILYKFMDPYAKEDYSWSRPNRRYTPEFYFPHMQSEQLEGAVSGIDVSGSMLDELDEVMAENRYIKSLVKPKWFHLMTWDTQVHHDKVYEEYEDLPIEEIPGGGAGGTIIDPLIKLIEEKQPRFALIFTDGYFSNPDMSRIKSDIYWIITKQGHKNFKAPDGVGEVIHMN